MKKEFVPYNLALKLKDLGFDGDYLHDKEVMMSMFSESDPKAAEDMINHEYTKGIKAPLWQQAFDWCLDKLKFVDSYAIIIDCDSYSLVIIDYYHNTIKETLVDGKTKEDCIERLIKLIELLEA